MVLKRLFLLYDMLQQVKMETAGVSWIIAGSQPSTGLLAMGVRFALRPAKSAEPALQG